MATLKFQQDIDVDTKLMEKMIRQYFKVPDNMNILTEMSDGPLKVTITSDVVIADNPEITARFAAFLTSLQARRNGDEIVANNGRLI